MWAVIYPALFLSSLFLADLSSTLHPERLYPPPSLPQNTNDAGSASKMTPLYKRVFYSCMLVSALSLLGQPRGFFKGYSALALFRKVLPGTIPRIWNQGIFWAQYQLPDACVGIRFIFHSTGVPELELLLVFGLGFV